MNVATPQSAPLPGPFQPAAVSDADRRRLYHHPTLHMRTGSGSNPQFTTHDFVTAQSSQIPPPPYSPSASSRQFRRSPSSQPTTPPAQQDTVNTYGQQNRFPQRYSTADSSSSLNMYAHSASLMPMGHRRQAASTSTSTSSINRIPSGHTQHPPLTPPIIQVRPGSASPADTYVARLRRAKATVWSARGQNEDLNRSNSKDDKYKKSGKRVVSSKV